MSSSCALMASSEGTSISGSAAAGSAGARNRGARPSVKGAAYGKNGLVRCSFVMTSAQSGEAASSSRRSAAKPSQVRCAAAGSARSGAPVIRGPCTIAIAATMRAISISRGRWGGRARQQGRQLAVVVQPDAVGEGEEQVAVGPEPVERHQVGLGQRARLLGRQVVRRQKAGGVVLETRQLLGMPQVIQDLVEFEGAHPLLLPVGGQSQPLLLSGARGAGAASAFPIAAGHGCVGRGLGVAGPSGALWAGGQRGCGAGTAPARRPCGVCGSAGRRG